MKHTYICGCGRKTELECAYSNEKFFKLKNDVNPNEIKEALWSKAAIMTLFEEVEESFHYGNEDCPKCVEQPKKIEKLKKTGAYEWDLEEMQDKYNELVGVVNTLLERNQ